MSSSQKKRIVFIDIETTGLNPFNSHIIEIAVKDNLGNSWETLIKSPTKLSQKITDITKITNEMINKNGISITEALQKTVDFIDGKNMNCMTAKWIIGHNLVGFDWAFIRHHCKLNKVLMPPYSNLLDTYRIAQYLLRDEYQSYKLCNLCTQFNLLQDGFHRAMNDICATEKLYNHFMDIFNSKKVDVKKVWELTTYPFMG
jgi:CRISPR-associated protein Cas2